MFILFCIHSSSDVTTLSFIVSRSLHAPRTVPSARTHALVAFVATALASLLTSRRASVNLRCERVRAPRDRPTYVPKGYRQVAQGVVLSRRPGSSAAMARVTRTEHHHARAGAYKLRNCPRAKVSQHDACGLTLRGPDFGYPEGLSARLVQH